MDLLSLVAADAELSGVIATQGNLGLDLTVAGLDLRGLALILLDLQSLKVAEGTLTGPVP